MSDMQAEVSRVFNNQPPPEVKLPAKKYSWLLHWKTYDVPNDREGTYHEVIVIEKTRLGAFSKAAARGLLPDESQHEITIRRGVEVVT